MEPHQEHQGLKRRDFMKKAALGAAAGAALVGCGSGAAGGGGEGANVQTQPNVRWRLASSFPPSLDTIYGAAEVMAEQLKALTDGRFQIQIYAGGELMPSFENFTAVQNGTVQMGHGASYYYIGQNEALAFDADVPFGLTARQYNAWIYHGGGMDLLRPLFADFNIVNFPGGNTGAQMGGWFTLEIGSLSDLSGITMRIPGLGGQVMNELGVNVQNLPGGEIYSALQRGTIDATEWVGPYDDEKLSFFEVAKNYYYPGWWEPGPALTFYVNQNEYDKLPSAYKEALKSACEVASVGMLAKYDALNPGAFQRLVQEHGVTARPFPKDVMDGARQATTDLLEQNASQDQTYRKIYEAFQKFRQDSYRWFDTAEQAYASYAFGTIGGGPDRGASQMYNPG